MDVDRFLSETRNARNYGNQIVCAQEIKARDAVYADLSRPLPECIERALAAEGIERLYTH